MSTITTEQMRFWSPEVRELEPYVPGEQPKIQNLLKLNTNENPYPPSPKVVEAVQAVLANSADVLRLYPDPDASELKQAIAKQQKVAVENVFVGNGSDEVLAHIFKAFFVQELPVLYPDITYSFYPVYSQFFGVKTKVLPLNDDFEIVVDDYKQANGGIIITNPNAPTSIALGLSAIEDVLQANPDSVVVIDEAYVDFGAQTAIPLIHDYPNVLVVQTFSKSRSLAGLRVGFAVGHPQLIQALERVKNSFNSYPLGRMAIAGAAAAMRDQAYFETTRQQIITTRDYTVLQLKALGFTVLPSAANFVFARPPQGNAEPIYLALKQKGVLVRYFNKPRIQEYLRITIGTDEEMQTFLAILATLTVL